MPKRKLRIVLFSGLFVGLLSLYAILPGGTAPAHAQGGSTDFNFLVSDWSWTFNPEILNPGPSQCTAGGGYSVGTGFFSTTSACDSPSLSLLSNTFSSFSGTSIEVKGHDGGGAGFILARIVTPVYSEATIVSGATVGDFDETWTFSASVTSVGLLCIGRDCTITEFIVNGLSLTATPTATLSSNPSSSGALFGTCLLLNDETAYFRNLPGQWTLPDGVGNPPSTTQGLLMPVGIASMPVYLDPAGQYQISLKFHLGTSPPSQDLSVGLGSGQVLDVSVSSGTGPQTYDSGYFNWQPDSDGSNQFTFKIVTEQFDSTPDMVIDYACISRNGETSAAPATIVTEDCTECIYAPKGGLANLPDDIFQALQWLWCGIRRIITCILAGMINGIWRVVVDIIAFLAFIRLWASLIIQRFIVWVLTNLARLWYWLGGTANNIIQWVVNTLATIWNALGGIINGILAFVRDLIFGAVDVLANIFRQIPAVLGIVGTVFGIVVFWLTGIVEAVARIVVAIPVFILAIVNGFNTPATSIPVYAPACNSSNTILFWPCVGSYIIDNTILDGPLYLVIIAVWGVIALMVILWALRHIRESMSA